MIAYFTIAATMVAGCSGAPWWSGFVGAALLALIGAAEQQSLQPRLSAVGGATVLSQAQLTNVALGSFTAAAAFVSGRMLSWLLTGVEGQLRILLQ